MMKLRQKMNLPQPQPNRTETKSFVNSIMTSTVQVEKKSKVAENLLHQSGFYSWLAISDLLAASQ